jgi:hypothetical protein
MFFLALTAALAAPGMLPSGSSTLYGGVGSSIWAYGMSGNPRDGAAIFRMDTWAGHGLAKHWMISAGVPLVHSRIVDDVDGRAPCPNRELDYCSPVTSLGDAHVLLSAGTRWKAVQLRGGVGPRTDIWTASTRRRYLNVGQGTVGGLAEASVGADRNGLGGFAEGRYLLRAGRTVPGEDFRAPSDAVQGQLAVFSQVHSVRLQASLLGHRQLSGVDYGPDYLRRLYATDDRWGVVAFRQLRAEAKVSVALSGRTGLHVAASRAIHTRNGPRDHFDASVGMHLWMPPKD